MVEAQSPFIHALLSGRPAHASGSAWLDRLRAAALERANRVALPTTRDEEWRFTDIAPLTRVSFQPLDDAPDVPEPALGDRTLRQDHARLTFVDGVYAPSLSRASRSRGLDVLDLASAIQQHPRLLEANLGRLAPGSSVFDALNTAYLRHAAVIVVADDAQSAVPVHILHLATRGEQPHAVYPRALVLAGARSRCTLIEDYTALGEAQYFSAPVSELVLGREAVVTHARLQCESPQAFQLASCHVRQDSASRYELVAVAVGARLSRLELNVVHAAPGCETQIDGLALIGKRQLADTHSFVDHAHPDGKLRQTHKCVVGDGAQAVFNGKILVREGAQHTDAAQSFRGLLLSERAQIDAKPQLEIFADDVKCAHGAAIGQLDPEEMFYLQSRGLGEARARNLLTYAFAAEVIERIPVAQLRSCLERTVLERTQEAP